LEVSAKGAHILALDPTELIKSELSPVETVELIHEQGATAILAHPFGLPRSWVNINQVRDAGFDAIEVANSAQIPYDYICSKNRELAELLNLPITGGSDSHIPETIGRSYTIVESESVEVDDVIKAIRLGHTTVGGTYTKITEWFSKNFKKKRRVLGF
jgi:predicted metal-dependent phosphoesterase TrpH